MPTFSCQIKMTLVVFVMLTAVLAGVSGLGFLYFTNEYKETVANRQFSVVCALAVELDDKILAAQRELMAVARSIPPELVRDPQAMRRFLVGRYDAREVFADGVGFLSATGPLLATSPELADLAGKDFSSFDFFRTTIATGKPCISEPLQISRGEGPPAVVFTAPVCDGRGKVVGMLGGRLDLTEENLLGRLARLKVGGDGTFFLVNRHKQLIVQRDRERQSRGEITARNHDLLDRAIAGFEGSGETRSYTGEMVLCSFKRLKSTGWILGGRLPVAKAYAPVYRARRSFLYRVAVAIPAALLFIWLFVGRLVRPLLVLTKRVGGMKDAGSSFDPLAVTRRDEIGTLAQAFNEVMQELGSQRALLEREKGLAERLLQQTAVACFVIDAQHRVIIWNSACEELTGLPAREVLGSSQPWRAFYDAPRPVLADIVIDAALNDMADLYGCYADSPLIPGGLRAEGWLRFKGKLHFLCFDAAPVRDAGGRMIAAIQTMQDVTLRVSSEEQLRRMVEAIGESEERFRHLVELSLDGIAILVERRFEFVNPAGCEMLGVQYQEELLGREMRYFLQRESEELFEEQLCYTEQSGSTAPWVEERLLRKDGTCTEVEVGVSRFVYRGKEALQVIFRDITERKLAKARLETLAHYDSLTSLPNRVLFFDRLQHAVSEAKRYNHAMALMFLDLDRFKGINDTLGHAAGDAVLVETGHRLKECVRACDMVARMGGDEFTIILTKMKEELDAALVAERIIQSLSVPFSVEDTIATIGVSIGICIYPTYGSDLDGMVRQADLALYRAKGDGRNCYCFYSPELKREEEMKKAG